MDAGSCDFRHGVAGDAVAVRLRQHLPVIVIGAGRKNLADCLELFPPKACIGVFKANLLKLVIPALRKIPIQCAIDYPFPGTSNLRGGSVKGLDEALNCEAKDGALLTFTSGSTGRPKPAMRTHGFLLHQHEILEKVLFLKEGERDLTTLPVFLLSYLASGLQSILPKVNLRSPGKTEPGPLLGQIERYKPSRLTAPPAVFSRLLEKLEREGKKLEGVNRVFTGGGPVFPDLLFRLSKAMPGAQVEAVYGSTEAEPIAHLPMEDISEGDLNLMACGKGLLAGKPIDDIRLKILSDQWGKPLGPWEETKFKENCLELNQPGEIVVAGGHVLKGYYKGLGDEETKLKVQNEIWHRTGDAGYLDAKGMLWLLGRCSAKIQDSKGDLYPFAVETAVSFLKGIERSALVSIRDRRILLLEKTENFKGPLEDNIRKSLEWAQIDEFSWIPKIPMDRRHNSKIDYTAIHRLIDNNP